MQQESSVIDVQLEANGVLRALIGDWTIELLPRAPYEVRYTPETPIIGYTFDSQSGTHAFASDRVRDFYAIPNGLARVPAGCEVYSQSSGGEYLKITGSTKPTLDIRPGQRCTQTNEQRFSDVVNPLAIRSALSLRCAMLSQRYLDAIECEHWILTLEAAVDCALSDTTLTDQHWHWLDKRRFRQLDDFIEARLETPLTVSKIAESFGVSAGFLSREFKSYAGRSPHQYIIDKRLANARVLVHQSTRELSDIACTCGFSSHSHLTSCFKKRFGITPTGLRQLAR